MFGPGARITRINLKPLMPERVLDLLSPEAALMALKRQIARSIQLKIRQSGLTPAAKAKLSKGFRVTVGDSSITVMATDPAFRPLIEGQKPRQMTWLTRARRPIPIVLDTGEVIFRNATPRSMEDGSWYHPGREPTGIIESAKEEAKEMLRKSVKRHLQEQLRAAIRRR